MAFTNTWNAAYEAIPPDTGENISQGANRIRALKNAIRERLAVDHYFEVAGTDADHGEHVQIRFHGNIATPANVANKSTLYPQIAANKLELFYKNDANEVVQLTANGGVNFATPIPAGTKMLFYADTAPTGWTIIDTMNDKLVFVTCGSANSGQTGGGAHSSGTWTQANHTLTISEMPEHDHYVLRDGSSDGTSVSATRALAQYWSSSNAYAYDLRGMANANYEADVGESSLTGGGNAHNHGSTWRPAAYCFICCNKT